MADRVKGMFFSGTGTTKKVVTEIANTISKYMKFEEPAEYYNFTLPEKRKEAPAFFEEDLVIVGVPVIAGRVPNVLLKYLRSIIGNGAMAVPVVLYGNRNYDDALIELADILKEDGFNVIAAGAFIGEHCFSYDLGAGRPDEKDLEKAAEFAKQICQNIKEEKTEQEVNIKGNKPYRDYYKPRDRAGNPVDIRKVTPKTNENCIDCKTCAEICPMGSIDYEHPDKLTGICIKCCGCIKICPEKAKYFDDADYLRHKKELEIEFAERREPEIFL